MIFVFIGYITFFILLGVIVTIRDYKEHKTKAKLYFLVEQEEALFDEILIEVDKHLIKMDK